MAIVDLTAQVAVLVGFALSPHFFGVFMQSPSISMDLETKPFLSQL
jgi:hypothetical protein